MKNFLMILFLFCALSQAFVGTESVRAEGESFTSVIPKDGDLGTAIKNGDLELKHIPMLIIYLINFLTYLAGSISVLMIMVGGVQYAIGSVTDEKEQGKKTITYASVGVFVSFSAWIIVNFIQRWITA